MTAGMDKVREKLAHPVDVTPGDQAIMGEFSVPQDQLQPPPSKFEPARTSKQVGDATDSPHAIELTEDGIAREFVQRHGNEFCYDHDAGRWYIWDDAAGCWIQDQTSEAFQTCREIAREASALVNGSVRATARKASTIAGVERLARGAPGVATTGDHWDRDLMLLGCPGVTVDLRTGKIRKPNPADGITKTCAVAPKSGPCPMWHSFLMDATGGDEDTIRFIQVWCGYLLTGQVNEHVLLFLFGAGGNGKSIFLNIVARILGDYAVTASMDTFVAAHGERHPTDLAMLRGARLVSASETEEGRAWAESKIKSITGGDPVTARFMRGDFFTYNPQFKLFLVGNHQPVLRNVDPAVRRRFLILPFTRQPARPDKYLEEKISKQEAPQILAWAIQGCLEWQEEGLPRPSSVTKATEQYFADQDLFGEWTADRCEMGNRAVFETAADLWASWKEFSEAAGERPGTSKRLGARLRRLGLENGPQRVAGKTSKVWFGVQLKSEAAR